MIIVISNSGYFLNEIYFMEKFLNEGVSYFHLRKPGYSVNKLRNYLAEIPKYLREKITIHQHYELIEEFDLGGIHFTSRTKNIISQYNNSDLRKSISCHSFDEIKLISDDINYAFLSPVFDSVSKTNYKGQFNNQKTKEFLKQKFNFKIIGLGGISTNNINLVKNLGFDGIALLGAVWKDPEDLTILNEGKNYEW